MVQGGDCMGSSIKIAGKIICVLISTIEIFREIKQAVASEKEGE